MDNQFSPKSLAHKAFSAWKLSVGVASIVGMEVLGARPVYSMSDPEKVSTLDTAMAELARLDALVLQLTGELERTGYAQEIGAGDTARFLSKRYRIDLPKARRTVRLATALDKHPATAAAMPDPAAPYADPATARPTPTEESADATEHSGSGGWRVHPDQAEAIISVLAKVPASVPIENVDFAEQRLIDLAATHTPQQLREAGKPILAILDPDGPEPSEKQAYARESLTWKNSDQGVKFQGFLACENAELFRTVIHSGAKPRKTVDGEPDPRPWSKRQADALTTALSNALNATPGSRANTARPSDNGSSNAGTANVHKTEPLEGVAAATDESDPATASAQDSLPGVEESSMSNPSSAAPDAAGANPDVGVVAGHGPKTHISVTIDYNDLKSAVSHATGTLMFGDTLSAATVRRLACDAELLPIVLGSKSQPLDVGTAQRLVTQPMRRALNARDKGCVACGAPPTQCEAHHLKHWVGGGITAVSNLVLLCKRDHIDLHSGHWTIQIIDDVVHVTRPTWTTPSPIPPNKYQPPVTDPHTDPSTANPSPRSSQRRLSVVAPARPDPHDNNQGSSHPGDPRTASHVERPTDPSGNNPWDAAASHGSHRAPNASPWPTSSSDPWGEDPQPNPPRAQAPTPEIPWANDPPPAPTSPPAIPWANDPPPPPPTAPTIPWADDPPPAPITPPTIPWANDPPPPVAAAPTAPWADDPEPSAATKPTVACADDARAARGQAVTDPRAGDAATVSMPSAKDGFDPWDERQDRRPHIGADADSAADQSRPIAAGSLGSVA
ncbi:DUF222 domain-containing protein [Kribbella sp. NPDC048928]|uniref:HNH endonuclease signature motif containing protein n=1 Tax=Kribbella sp. NPDC048928 TaxID=3364111 RepID=UPI003716A5EE